MLSNLNTNMKVLIGISSIAILGILYSIIKNYFSSKNKMVEEQTKQKSNPKENVLKENDLNELKNISTNIESLHNTHRDHMDKMNDHMNNVEEHHNFLNDTLHNVRRNKKTIVLDNNNTDYDNTTGVLTIKNDIVKSELGFPYAIYSIVFVSATIPKTSRNTSSVKLLVIDSALQQFLGNSDILSIIPLEHTSGTSNNEDFSHYTVANINHNIIRNPVSEQTLTLKLLQADGITHHDLTSKQYSITIEIVVGQGIQVSENGNTSLP